MEDGDRQALEAIRSILVALEGLVSRLLLLGAGAGGAFTGPDSLTGCTAFWDINKASSVTNSSGITQVADLVGSNNLTAAGTNKPAYNASGGFNNRGYAHFDGTTDFLFGSAGVLFGSNKFSVAVRANGAAQFDRALVNSNYDVNPGFILGTGNIDNTKVRFYLNDAVNPSDSLASTDTAFDSTWHTIVITWDGVTKKVYVDSTTPSTNTPTYVPLASTITPSVGARNNGGAPEQFFAGDIEYVAIYNVALTSVDVSQLITYGS